MFTCSLSMDGCAQDPEQNRPVRRSQEAVVRKLLFTISVLSLYFFFFVYSRLFACQISTILGCFHTSIEGRRRPPARVGVSAFARLALTDVQTQQSHAEAEQNNPS